MGLHAVSQFLKTKHPHLIHTEHLSLFAHTRVFVDVATYIFRFVCKFGTHKRDSTGSKHLTYAWFNSFFKFMLCFKQNGVTVIPVFDGQAPPAKLIEQTVRRETRQKQKDRATSLAQALKVSDPDIICKELKLPLDTALTHAHLTQAQELIDTIELQTSYVAPTELAFLQELLTACGICWVQAPEEAEAYCSFLVRHKFGKAVVSYDTDCIAHRADIIIFSVDFHTGTITFMNTCELLETLQFSEEQMVDFAILVGCDYNPNSRVNGIGPVNAVKLLQKHGCIENIPNLNTEVLLYQHIRTLFNPVHDLHECSRQIRFVEPNVDKLQSLAEDKADLNVALLMELATGKAQQRYLSAFGKN
jgi:5'-3' exonuclease